MRVLGVIPARLGSTRLPNKPLQLLAGEPLITRVIQRVMEHDVLQDLVVATDSHMVAQVVERAGVRAVLTHDGHLSGTDRVAEVAARRSSPASTSWPTSRATSPSCSREALAGAIERVERGDDIGTAAAPLAPELAADPARVKVVTDARRAGAVLFAGRRSRIAARPTDPAEGLYWQHVGPLRVHPRGAGALGGGPAESGRAGRAAGAAPRAASAVSPSASPG